jgi:hypothetical protein
MFYFVLLPSVPRIAIEKKHLRLINKQEDKKAEKYSFDKS